MARVPDPAVLESLTPLEREVLELLRRGLTDREIGEQLGVSTQGATFHVALS